MVSYTHQDGTYSALPLDWYIEADSSYESKRLKIPVGIMDKVDKDVSALNTHFTAVQVPSDLC